MPEPQAAVRWRMPVIGWIAIGLVVLVLCFLFWLQADGDLRRIDARAKAMGVVATWPELGLRASPPTRLADWARLGQLAEALKNYQESASWRPRPDQPLPPELAQHHASLPGPALADLLALCDGLPPEGLVLRTTCSFDTIYAELMWLRAFCRLTGERVLLARPEDVLAESARMIRVITARKSQLSLHERLVSISCLNLWVQAVAWRLERAPLDREALAVQADDLRAWLDAEMAGVMEGEFRIWRTLAVEVHLGRSKALASFTRGFDGPGGFLVGRTFMRAARGGTLDLMLDLAEGWRATGGYLGRHATMETVQTRLMDPSWTPSRMLSRQVMVSGIHVNDSWMKADTGLLVLAAELRGQPWPADPTDRKGLPIRRIERGGRLIGCYLLGGDQRDDGGRIKGDLCVPLYGRLGSVKAADPVKDP